ncbi:transglutaminase TgpA family protein [Sedimenticola sp.]|uniref:transglutaminase TgpA family protein n=1 Tax=Sedimenticola sp. TaxID=1940285 RepID=UPI003D098AAA
MNPPPLSRASLLSLSLISLLVVAPHFAHLDLRITLAFMAALLIRLATLYRPLLRFGRWLLLAVTLSGAALTFTVYPLLIGLQAKVALLSLMLGLKLMECRQRRDLYVVVFLGYFTLITHFLFEQGMLLVVYVWVLVIGLSGLLIEASRSHSLRGWPLRSLWYATRMTLQALPVMLLLFFLFPRISGPLWNLGVDNSTGQTGLTDNISLGSISKLIRSRAVAFRVDFDREMPPTQLRYWRGPVLWQTDGRRWTRAQLGRTGPVTYRSDAPPIRYQVTLEPSSNDWLYALDLPETLPSEATLLPDFQIVAKDIRNRRHRYTATSRLRYHTGPLDDWQRRLGLQLPDSVTPRMQALATTWRRETDSDRQLVERALQYFRREPFYYTLNPPQLESNPVDQFLFESRRGFCEHYATSFTLLMRLAGIPARVVTGYQGGERNPLGNYLIVRQSDAHAWSEVWLEQNGWTRIDPTAAVAPERIERTFEFDLAENAGLGIPLVFSHGGSDLLGRLTKQFRLGVDAANASWHRWILGYSKDQQQRLMQWLGFGSLSAFKLALTMVLSIAALVPALMLLLHLRGRARPDPVQGDYLKFCRRLARKGLERQPHEGPRDFARRVIRQRPDLQRSVSAIVQLYIALRYGAAPDPQQRQRLHRLVRNFRA